MIGQYNTLSISEAVLYGHFLLHIIWFTTIWIAFNVEKEAFFRLNKEGRVNQFIACPLSLWLAHRNHFVYTKRHIDAAQPYGSYFVKNTLY